MYTNGDPEVDECLGWQDDPCYADEPVEPFVLTAEQSNELDDVVRDIPRDACDPDEQLGCDPCLITTVMIDSFVTEDDCCGEWLLGAGAAIADLTAFLDALAPS